MYIGTEKNPKEPINDCLKISVPIPIPDFKIFLLKFQFGSGSKIVKEFRFQNHLLFTTISIPVYDNIGVATTCNVSAKITR